MRRGGAGSREGEAVKDLDALGFISGTMLILICACPREELVSCQYGCLSFHDCRQPQEKARAYRVLHRW